jgi:hypothetical protein
VKLLTFLYDVVKHVLGFKNRVGFDRCNIVGFFLMLWQRNIRIYLSREGTMFYFVQNRCRRHLQSWVIGIAASRAEAVWRRVHSDIASRIVHVLEIRSRWAVTRLRFSRSATVEQVRKDADKRHSGVTFAFWQRREDSRDPFSLFENPMIFGSTDRATCSQ